MKTKTKKWTVTWAFYNHGELDGNYAVFDNYKDAKKFLDAKREQANALEPAIYNDEQWKFIT